MINATLCLTACSYNMAPPATNISQPTFLYLGSMGFEKNKIGFPQSMLLPYFGDAILSSSVCARAAFLILFGRKPELLMGKCMTTEGLADENKLYKCGNVIRLHFCSSDGYNRIRDL